MASPEHVDMERAEDLFHAYGVDFDPRVLAVYRLPLLRRFGLQVTKLTELPVGPEERRRLMAASLAEAHAHFAQGGKAEIQRPSGPLVTIRTKPRRPES
jgi:hypothetical protein